MTRNEALNIRRIIEKAALSLEDADAASAAALFPRWVKGREYAAGDRVCHGGGLYKCLAVHVSQNGWEPDVSPSLFVRMSDPKEEYPGWIRPTGAHDAYALGAKVLHGGKKWISTVDANVYEPGIFGWEEVTDG